MPGQPEYRTAIPGTSRGRQPEVAAGGFPGRHATGAAVVPATAWPCRTQGRQTGKTRPDFVKIHPELTANRSVTLQLLWQEFVEEHPDGAHYSGFCQQYRDGARHLDVVLRPAHRAGENTFVDHAGDTIPVIHPSSGQIRPAFVFVAVLGASNYTYAEATWTRGLPDWIGSHPRALAFFDGATRLIVPDPWKAGVHKPCSWEPELNRTDQVLETPTPGWPPLSGAELSVMT